MYNDLNWEYIVYVYGFGKHITFYDVMKFRDKTTRIFR